jgi:C1A family cysteine protease
MSAAFQDYIQTLDKVQADLSNLTPALAKEPIALEYRKISQLFVSGEISESEKISVIIEATSRGLVRTGWQPSNYTDKQDQGEVDNYIEFENLEKVEVPAAVNLKDRFTAIDPQVELNSCVAHAVTSVMEYWGMEDPNPFPQDISNLFLYKLTRLLMQCKAEPNAPDFPDKFEDAQAVLLERNQAGMSATNDGTSFRDTFEIVGKLGVISQQNHADDRITLADPLDDELFNHLVQTTDWSYFRLEPVNGEDYVETLLLKIKLCLAAKLPLVFGFRAFLILHDAPPTDENQSEVTSKIPYVTAAKIEELKRRADLRFDGHALVAVGYDDQKEALLVRNSWGEAWGSQGYAWLPYKYVGDGQAIEWWSLMNTQKLQEIQQLKKQYGVGIAEAKDIDAQERQAAQLTWKLKDDKKNTSSFGIVKRRIASGKIPIFGPPCPSGVNCK